VSPPAGTVVVVGSVNADYVVTADRLPSRGETVTGGRLGRHQGGKGANQAVAAARAGAAVRLVGAVGDDEDGRAALEALRREGVDVEGVATVDEPTGAALIVVDRDGDNQIAVASGANHAFGLERLEHALRGRPGVLLTCFEVPDAAVEGALQAAGERGWRLVVNPAPARPLPEGVRRSGAVLTPNAGEWDELGRTGAGGPVAVTLGADGVDLHEEGAGPTRIAAPRVDVVDTTGAGDVFNGALAAALAQGEPLADAVRRGVEAAAQAVTRPGARG
jgi:ribokinase